jgi:hypothetical protein
MIGALRQVVDVEEDGKLEVRSPELRKGTVAEVIVLVSSGPRSPAAALAALEELKRAGTLDQAAAEKWMGEIRAERDAWGRPPDR